MATFDEELIYVIGHNESGNSYASINLTDVISIGLFNWYGARALGLARTIVAADPVGSQSALSSAEHDLYGQITSGDNNVWNSYRPGTSLADMAALRSFLDLEASHTAQNALALSDGNGYVSQGKARGITDARALIYFADLYNQSPKQAGCIVDAVKKAGLALTIGNLHNYAMQNPVMKKYSTRRNWTYNEIISWESGVEPDVPVTDPVQPPNNNGGGNLPPSAYQLADYMVVVNSDTMVHFDAENPTGNVWVRANNIWIPTITG